MIMEALAIEKIISSEKNLKRILENLRDGVIAHDMQRRIFYFNRKAEEITGYSRAEVLARDCHDAFGEPFCGAKCNFCNQMPTLKDSTEYTINITTKGGESRRIEMFATMMVDRQNKPLGILATFRDITEILELKIKARDIYSFANIVGRNSKMLDVFRQIRELVDYDFPVHIYGETGTGKELVAMAIHNESHRSGAPFAPINCGALPEGLIESELFGHVKGSFSGAIRDKKGRFELADGGTIFLDEVAELPKHLQVKLLRFLQEGTIEKVGSEKTLSLNTRVISATNKDLKEEIRKGNFREDLYYRLNVIPINIPAVRDRKTDIPLLVDHFLQQVSVPGKTEQLSFSREAMAMMMGYKWPGNVREIQNAVQFSIVKSTGSIILPSDLPIELKNVQAPVYRRGPSLKLDADVVRAALRKAGGNKSKAARLLGVGRATLYRFLSGQKEMTDRG
jgi:PAS domain S-box-containing protein